MKKYHHGIVALSFFTVACGCGDGAKPSGDNTKDASAAVVGGTQKSAKTKPASSGDGTKDGIRAKDTGGQEAIAAISARLLGTWTGGIEIVDKDALRRHGEKMNGADSYPDPVKRKAAVDKFVADQTALHKRIKSVLIVNKDGTCAHTSMGTDALSDGTAQKGTWKITKADGDQADIVIEIVKGYATPYVLRFTSDAEFTLRISPSMPGYTDAARATGERYKKK